MKLLVGSDFHIRETKYAGRTVLRGDSAYATKQFADVVRRRAARAVLLSGDTFDRPTVNADEVAQAMQFVPSGSDASLYHVQGQHDDQGHWSPSILSSLSSRCVSLGLKESIVSSEGETIRIVGMNWCRDFKERLADVPPCDILVVHQAFKETLSFEGAYQAELADLPDHACIVISGDIHCPVITKLPGGRLFMSPGSIYQVDSGDSQDCGVWTIDTRTLETERIRFKTRRTVKVDLRGKSQTEAEKLLRDAADPNGDHLPVLVEAFLTPGDPPVSELSGVLVRETRLSDETPVSNLEHKSEFSSLEACIQIAAEGKRPEAADLVRKLVLEGRNPRETLTKVVECD